MKLNNENKILDARDELENKFQQQIEELTRVNQKLKLEIIDLKETEQVLRERETGFKRAQQMGKVGNWEWDITQNKTTWSEELYRIFDVKPEEFDPNAYETFLNCIYPDDRALVEKTIEKAIADKNPFKVEYRIVHQEGKVRDIFARGEVICDDQGNPVKMLGTSQDITDRKQAEERFLGVLESAPDALIITNEDGVIQFSNNQTKKLFGYEQEELLGEKVEKLMPQRFRTKHSNHQKNYKSNPKTRAMGEGLELLGLRKDGEEIPIEISLGPVKTYEGIMVTAAIRDITKRKHEEDLLKKVEVETKRLRTELEHVNRVGTLDALASALAHEINQPLAAILSNAQAAIRFLNNDQPDIKEVRDALIDIVKDDKRAGEIIRQIRGLVKKGELSNKPYKLNRIIKNVLKLIHGEIVIDEITLTTDLDSGIRILSGDSTQMQQVILNILMNAVEAVKEQPADTRSISRTKASTFSASTYRRSRSRSRSCAGSGRRVSSR